jgi:hypothetical protein
LFFSSRTLHSHGPGVGRKPSIDASMEEVCAWVASLDPNLAPYCGNIRAQGFCGHDLYQLEAGLFVRLIGAHLSPYSSFLEEVCVCVRVSNLGWEGVREAG